MSEVIGIISGKGGVGKTTLTANLGTAISKFEEKPLLVDGNIRASSLGFHLGYYDDLPVTLEDITNEDTPLQHGVFSHPTLGFNFVLSKIEGTKSELGDRENFLQQLKENHNLVLVDFPPAFSQEAIKCMDQIDKAILILTTDSPAFADLTRTIKLLREKDKDIIGVVINKAREETVDAYREQIEKSCQEEVLVEIPYDPKVKKALSKAIPVVKGYPCCKAAIKINKLAAKLLGIEWSPPGMLTKLKRLFCMRKKSLSRNIPLKGTETLSKDEEPFICKYCDRDFDSERALHIHQSKKHRKE